MFKHLVVTVLVSLMMCMDFAHAQEVNVSGDNQFIRQYVEAAPQNWDTPIMFVFYDDEYCVECAAAIRLIYNIYQENYADSIQFFEIDYALEDEFQLKLTYDLTQPLSIVVVRIRDGMAQGFYKIDNPQFWMNDPYYFREKIINGINNFLNM